MKCDIIETSFRSLMVLLVLASVALAFGGNLFVETSGGIMLPNEEYVPDGSLVQLIYAGTNGEVDPPNADPDAGVLGAPTVDDTLIATTEIGYGYLGDSQGNFNKLFTSTSIKVSAPIYIRVWNSVGTPPLNTLYGSTSVYVITSATLEETYSVSPFVLNNTLSEDVELGGYLVIESTTGAELLGGDKVPEGYRVDFIYAGTDSAISPPQADITDPVSLGSPGGDDILIERITIGTGYDAGTANGRFHATIANSILQPGAWVYVRVWDTDQTPSQYSYYGSSSLYKIVQGILSETKDFGTIVVDQSLDDIHTPIELNNFDAKSLAGRVVLTWSTMSESENLGFHIYKAPSLNGPRTRVNQSLIRGAINSETRHDYSFEDVVVEDGVRVYYWLVDVATDGTVQYHGPVQVTTKAAPDNYAVKQNFPNPFNPATTITFQIKEKGHVFVSIYDIRGRQIRELVNETRTAGEYQVVWDGQNSNGFQVASGLYFFNVRCNGFQQTKKMTLMK